MRRLTGPPQGATAVEYLVIIVLVSLVIFAVIEVFGGGVEAQFQAVADLMMEDMGRETSSSAQEDGSARSSASSSSGRARDGASSTTSEGAPGGASSREQQALEGSPPAATGSVGGINPVVILIVIGLLLLLGYLVFGGKKD